MQDLNTSTSLTNKPDTNKNNEKKDIRILEVVDNYFPIIDGVVNVVDNYSRLLNKKENVICEALVPWYPKSYDGGGYNVIRSLSMSGGKYGVRLPLPFFDLKLKHYLKKNHFDIIHCHSPVTLAKFSLRYAKKHNIPVVFTIHTRYHEEINRSVKLKCLQKFALYFTTSTINKFDHIWSVSEGNIDCLHNEYKIDKPCKVVRNGTDIAPVDVDTAQKMRNQIRQKHNILQDEIVLLFVGRLVKVKDISFAISSVAKLKEDNFNVKFIIAGDGDYKNELKKQCKQLNVEDRVLFVGNMQNRNELVAYYNSADLFVFPSTFDSCPLVVKEASAMNLPSLVVKGSSSAEGIIDCHNGYTQDKEILLWANKIKDIFSDDAINAVVKSNCQKELYSSWQNVVDDVYLKYCDIIDSSKCDGNSN